MTSTEQSLIAELVGDLIERHQPFVLSPEQPWDPALWADLAATGLTALGDEDSLPSVQTAVDVLSGLARGAAAVPFAEHVLVARPIVAKAGLKVPLADEVTTFAVGQLLARATSDDTWLVSGSGSSPWLTVAEHVLLVADSGSGSVLGLAKPAQLDIRQGTNVAGEPLDIALADDVRLDAVRISDDLAHELKVRFALARSAQLFGALRETLVLTLRYSQERQQFGRTIARFQSVQVMVAEIAEEVALVAASVHAAAQAVATGSEDASLLVSACKVNAGNAVRTVARNAHQVHGAIGFTQEHPLHHLTRRCWSWRDEAGAEFAHARAMSLALAPREPPGAFWAALTGGAADA
jgi:acyl-CoA dehydrogenase